LPIGCQLALTPVVNCFTDIKPKRILDVGIGCGTYGLLFREYSDIMWERYKKEDWEVIIDGVEIWDDYLTPAHEHWYNRIYIGDVRNIELEDYDLIYMGDIIEHFTKEDGLQLLDNIKKHAKHIIVTTPAWFGNPEHDPLGNPNEHHLSLWTLEDFPDWEVLLKEPIVVHWTKK
jgi:2-polyprenyl-3-methyl-5-hydroxy-6-metoxy-1,4-benzoquinol methylase